jgi:uncharacterized protein YndB with AHSA1/START domain
MKHDSIEREIHVDAAPDVVYEVISMPEHLREWWPDEAELEPVAGATGVISFGDRSTPDANVVPLTVVEADPPRRFSFRWAYDEGDVANPANSLLVTFELIPSGAGTLMRFTETGFREAGVSEEQYHDHVTGWDHFLPGLVTYVHRLVSTP